MELPPSPARKSLGSGVDETVAGSLFHSLRVLGKPTKLDGLESPEIE